MEGDKMKNVIHKEMTFKQMEKMISEIFLILRQVKIHLSDNVNQNEELLLTENEDFPYMNITNKELSRKLFLIRQSLFSLDDEERKLIINDFYYRNFYWWEEYYSRSTFYRKKKKAMTSFLHYFNFKL